MVYITKKPNIIWILIWILIWNFFSYITYNKNNLKNSPNLFSNLTICFSCSLRILWRSASEMDTWLHNNFLFKKTKIPHDKGIYCIKKYFKKITLIWSEQLQSEVMMRYIIVFTLVKSVAWVKWTVQICGNINFVIKGIIYIKNQWK